MAISHNDVPLLPFQSYKYGQLLYTENIGKLQLFKGKAVSLRCQGKRQPGIRVVLHVHQTLAVAGRKAGDWFPKNITNGGPK